MDITYKVRGSDGKEYGPVTLEQVSHWLRENRVTPDTEIMRNDMSHWAAAKDFTELQPALPATPLARIVVSPSMQRSPAVDPALATRMKSGASWFYWIAGVSLVNSVVAMTGSHWRFVLGLGITQIIDAFGQHMANGGQGIALGLDVAVAGVFVMFGIFANKRQAWAFVVGMGLFALDGVFSIVFQDWLGLAFHAFALYSIFRGFAAARELK